MTSCMILFEGNRSIHDVGFTILDQEEKRLISPSLQRTRSAHDGKYILN